MRTSWGVQLGLVLLCTSLMLVAASVPAQVVDRAVSATDALAIHQASAAQLSAAHQTAERVAVQAVKAADSGAMDIATVARRAKEESAVKFGWNQTAGTRACADCLTPNVALGDIGADVWGYSQTGDCATEGKWYASFNGYTGLIYHFDLCADEPGTIGTGNFDADIKVVDANCAILTGVDGSCSGPNSYLPNDFQWTCTADGTYYVVIAPYRSYNQHNCIGTSAETFTLSYYAAVDPCTGNYPPNDTCEQLPTYYGGFIPTLADGVPFTFYGDNTCAQPDCSQFPSSNVWEAFTVSGNPAGWNITLDYCGTATVWGNAYLNLMTGCPCTTFTAAASPWSWSCPDGNVSMTWNNLPDGTYYYPVMYDEANGSVGAYTLNVVAVARVPGYCDAGSSYTNCDEYISQVQVGSIDNSTACSQPGGYGDYTSLSTDMTIGSGYAITVTNGNPYSSDQCKVWVDWNQDLDFYDAGEAFTMSGVPGVGPYTGTIMPPVGALEGATRMRVRITYTGTLDPCGITSYGEVEDYTINVLPAGAEGACCTGMDCAAPVTEPDCLAAGGIYMGNGSNCTPNPCFGACCFVDGSCQETLDEAACTTLGGMFYGTGTSCSPNLCPQPGNNCNNPKPIVISPATVPYMDVDTTCGRGNDYSETCLGSYDGGEDIIYELTLTQDMCLKIAVDGVLTWLGVAIDSACPPGSTCIAYNTNSSGNPAINNLNLVAGTYYIMIDTWPSPDCSDFTLMISECPPPPPNDLCADAIAVTNGAPAATGDNCAASDDGTASCQTNSHLDLWYRYAATCVGTVVMDTEGSMQSDTVLSVLDACGGTELACDDDGGTGTLSLLSIDMVEGQEVWIRVASYSSGCGGFNLNIVCNAWPQGACCQPDGSCYVTYEPYCTGAGGTYVGDNTVCGGLDCNTNGADDTCDILNGLSQDCNGNGIPDECDLASGYSVDVDLNGVPDECDPDCNENGVPDACELPGGCATGNCGTVYPDQCGTALDCQGNGIPDECDLAGGGGVPVTYQYDDGTHENSLGLTNGGTIAWMNRFIVVDGGESITSISVAWGTVPDGTECTVYLWSDPNQDGDPTDAQVIASAPTLVANADMDILTTVEIPTSSIGPTGTSFFAGAYISHASGEYPASFDQNGVLHGQSWIAGDTTFNLDPNNLGGGDVAPVNIDTIGYAGNWLIRAAGGGGGSADCNGNGIPDECDVPPICQGPDCSQDCNFNLVPDECEEDCNGNGRPDDCDINSGYSLDCNANEVPDECDIAAGTSQDCNGNSIPDECDIAVGTSQDCNENGIPDECDIAMCDNSKWCRDCQGDGIPDGCQLNDARDILWDNGPIATGAGCSAQISELQDSLGLGSYGMGAQQSYGNRIADDFTIESASGCDITTITLYSYQTGATPPTINSVFMQIWDGPPNAGGTVIWGDLATNILSGVTAGGIFRTLPTIDCSRQVQICVCTVGTHLDQGTYWIDFTLGGTGSSGPWIPPVTILGQAGKEGANALQYTTDDGWLPVTDVVAQDFPFLVEGSCGPLLNDCNENQIPDECDIGTQWGGFCTRPPEDPDGPCDSDWNGDGIPDSCQVCGDLDGDDDIDLDDYWEFLAAFGTCEGDLKYNPAADSDGDNCITLVDYRAWRMCYRMQNGQIFIAPKPTPVQNVSPVQKAAPAIR